MIRKTFIGVDYLTFALILWNLLYVGIGWARVASPLTHLLSYFSIGVGILFLVWLEWQYSSTMLRFFRYAYPILLFGYFFESTSGVNHIIFRNFLDPFFQNLDQMIFGYQPVLLWGVKYSGFVIQEISHFSYFSYYLMIAGIPIYLYVKKRPAFHETLFAITFVFYLCYFIYSWLPVIGGRYFQEAMQLSTTYQDGIFTRIMAFIYNKSPHLGGAFPSSHVAISIVITIAAVRYVKSIGYVLIPITLMLCLSTVHGHYHYFVDVIAGFLTGIILYPVSVFFYKKWPVPIKKPVLTH
jgi:membrane-associated phospholipid phosphatase